MNFRFNRQIVGVEIPQKSKLNGVRLAAFIIKEMIYYHFRSLLFLFCFVWAVYLLISDYLTESNPSILLYILLIAFLLGIISVSEEFSHAAAGLQKRKYNEVKELRISLWNIGRINILVESFGIRFKGMLSSRDMIHVTAAGPLFALITGIFFFIILWYAGINRPGENIIAFYMSLFFIILPVLSLMPYKLGFISDGGRLLEIKKINSLKISLLIKEMFYGLFLVIKFFINPGSKSVK